MLCIPMCKPVQNGLYPAEHALKNPSIHQTLKCYCIDSQHLIKNTTWWQRVEEREIILDYLLQTHLNCVLVDTIVDVQN